jgi:hypothetical protein
MLNKRRPPKAVYEVMPHLNTFCDKKAYFRHRYREGQTFKFVPNPLRELFLWRRLSPAVKAQVLPATVSVLVFMFEILGTLLPLLCHSTA